MEKEKRVLNVLLFGLSPILYLLNERAYFFRKEIVKTYNQTGFDHFSGRLLP